MENQPINTKLTLIALGALILVLLLITLFTSGPRLTRYGPGPDSRKLSPDEQALLFQSLKEAVTRMEIEAKGFKSEVEKFDHLQKRLRIQ
ncbi:MAG: hypothetical protein HYW77_02810 [Parcubacteria group bacterium]|nr:hypothetical protein [Parcubacteria group bacterium]